jgi:hypothetical protein
MTSLKRYPFADDEAEVSGDENISGGRKKSLALFSPLFSSRLSSRFSSLLLLIYSW